MHHRLQGHWGTPVICWTNTKEVSINLLLLNGPPEFASRFLSYRVVSAPLLLHTVELNNKLKLLTIIIYMKIGKLQKLKVQKKRGYYKIKK